MSSGPRLAPTWQDEPLQGLQDPRLRPRLLYSVLQNLPKDDKTSVVPAKVTRAADLIRRHHLLQEPPLVGLAVGGHKDPRKVAVNVWETRVMTLIASTQAINRWAGACLLGIMCEECSKERFLSSYRSWFTHLLPLLKAQAGDGGAGASDRAVVLTRGAACSALTDLLNRLGHLMRTTGVKKEGNDVNKLWGPLVLLLSDDSARSSWGEAVDLISAILTSVPANLRQHCDAVEVHVMTKLMDPGGCSRPLQRKLSRCLALLPRAVGDAGMWSQFMRRVLISIHLQLDAVFAGMEDAALAAEWRDDLLPPGEPMPPQIGVPAAAAHVDVGDAAEVQAHVQRLLGLLDTCHHLLVTSYPVAVPLPLGSVVALVTRVLRVDGSRAAQSGLNMGMGMGVLPVSAEQQEALCMELPVLHLSSLKLLMALLRSAKSLMVPLVGEVMKLLCDCFRRTSFSTALRLQLYSTSMHYLTTFGSGMVLMMAPALVRQALSDLNSSVPGLFSPRLRTPHGGSGQGMSPGGIRKRKEPGGLPGDFGGLSAGELSPREKAAPVEIQVAALQALETILTTGGSQLPPKYRNVVDGVVASAAMQAVLVESFPLSTVEADVTGVMREKQQLAACRALLASILSPTAHRPPFLGQALVVFQRGRFMAGTELARLCSSAALALEPLLHPRCLPPQGSPAALSAQRPPATLAAANAAAAAAPSVPGASAPATSPVVSSVSGRQSGAGIGDAYGGGWSQLDEDWDWEAIVNNGFHGDGGGGDGSEDSHDYCAAQDMPVGVAAGIFPQQLQDLQPEASGELFAGGHSSHSLHYHQRQPLHLHQQGEFGHQGGGSSGPGEHGGRGDADACTGAGAAGPSGGTRLMYAAVSAGDLGGLGGTRAGSQQGGNGYSQSAFDLELPLGGHMDRDASASAVHHLEQAAAVLGLPRASSLSCLSQHGDPVGIGSDPQLPEAYSGGGGGGGRRKPLHLAPVIVPTPVTAIPAGARMDMRGNMFVPNRPGVYEVSTAEEAEQVAGVSASNTEALVQALQMSSQQGREQPTRMRDGDQPAALSRMGVRHSRLAQHHPAGGAQGQAGPHGSYARMIASAIQPAGGLQGVSIDSDSDGPMPGLFDGDPDES